MSSLKEIKSRIVSVKSTRKITSAMKMVASAKLRRAQSRIENFLPYQNKLMDIQRSFLSAETDFTSPLAEKRNVRAVAIVVLSSNSSFCGAFNSNVGHLFRKTLEQYAHLSPDNIYIYALGKKIEDTLKKEAFTLQGSYIELIDKTVFDDAKKLADELVDLFLSKKVDRVVLLYNHFKSASVQVLTEEQFLPIVLETGTQPEKHTGAQVDYIVEPDKKTILSSLIPKSLRSKIYSVILDSAAAEQAARMVAMQIATDNADDILDELTIQYNKQRQQSITGELLDIIGGAEALK
ncbi:MAG: F0F1 ATP synthase subunit gamma [Dysgonamonadaceae bacterium]|jgi:F-type H+-transporting ATPase subunit gamma|nr:F0F1 ATP synthase subunit gamma [Dysgonamonadaceae bacterium]